VPLIVQLVRQRWSFLGQRLKKTQLQGAGRIDPSASRRTS